jgi:ABC-type amino acid transport substrate-binding protein
VLRGAAAAAAAAAWPPLLAQPAAGGGTLARLRDKGRLLVGLYQELPPFHDQGHGIDVEIGRSLAAALQLRFEPLPFQAGENMGDDLRNMVWKGHYLGWGPADVLLHVPLDPPLLRANPQVQVVAPYYREGVALALDRAAFPREVDSLSELNGRRVAVPGLSLAGWLLLGAEGGGLGDSLTTRLPDGVAAAESLKRGEVQAAAGLASELECALRGDARFLIQPLPTPRAPRDGWAVGCAVRKDADDLAAALQQAMQGLRESGRLRALFQDAGVPWRL